MHVDEFVNYTFTVAWGNKKGVVQGLGPVHMEVGDPGEVRYPAYP